MEISTAAPPSLSLPTPKSPETDQADTPTPAPASARIQPTKSLPFTNGVHKRHPPPHLHHHHHTSPATRPPAVSYKECMKNHAATMGGHALDGCGEFMPSPAAVPTDPTSLKCAACGCHRNFHRRESPAADENHRQPHHHQQPHPLSAAPTTHVIEYHPHHRHHPPPPPPYNGRSPNSQSPPPISSSYYPSSAPHMLLALSGGAATGNGNGSALPSSDALHSPHGRKRFRTKFSQDQKEKMQKFAEKLGWKMQKASEEMVVEFCGDVGVERGVFKVWMHNNKNTFTKRDSNGAIRPGIGDTAANQTAAAAAAAAAATANDNNGSSGNSGSHGYSKNGDGTYGSSTSS